MKPTDDEAAPSPPPADGLPAPGPLAGPGSPALAGLPAPSSPAPLGSSAPGPAPAPQALAAGAALAADLSPPSVPAPPPFLEDALEETLERRSGADDAAVAPVGEEPESEFELQKTTELSTVGTPAPVSLGPRAPLVEAPATSGDPALDAAVQALQTLKPTSTSTSLPPPPAALYEDPVAVPPLGIAGALDEKTTDLVVSRLARHTMDGGVDGGSDDASKLPTDEGATVEGAPVDEGAEQRTDVGPVPPLVGETITADDDVHEVKLEASLGEQGGMVFYRARVLKDGVDLGAPFTAVWMPSAPPEPPWAHLPDARLVRPRCRVSLERAAIRVFERPKGSTVIDYLSDEERLLPAMATIELGLELAELLESLHGAGVCLYDIDPSQIVIEKGGRVRLYAVSGLYPAGQLPPGALGVFCAPEVRRRMSYRVSSAADVYAVALLLYALLAKRAPLDIDTDPSLLVSPRVFRPECPLGVWPYLKTCLEANPLRRVGHARGLRQQLEAARARLIAEAKATDEQGGIVLEGWAEQHAGLAKARRGSGQQDRALSVTDESGKTGLYLISDGVSRSRYGDGAFAAEQVEVAALQRWTGLEKAGPQALELQHAQRADILKQISRSAGKRIAAEINAKHAPIPNEPNQVMSATMVAAFVVNGEATLGNLGDSRAYLVRDGVIEQISIDHDRATDALRLGLTFREAAHVQMATALTRVVGRVVVDDDGTCRPDPFEPELFRLRLLPGDRLVLCSDGVADFAAGAGLPQAEQDARIRQTVLEYDDPARAAFELVVLANRAGGYDNISCVVLAVHAA